MKILKSIITSQLTVTNSATGETEVNTEIKGKGEDREGWRRRK